MHSPKTIVERFSISNLQTDLLGNGAMGDVYRGVDLQTGVAVAIKALKSELVNEAPELVSRFIREGEALRKLNHPNIVKMLNAVEEREPATGVVSHYLIMEYVRGGSLRDLLDRSGQLPIDRVLQIALELSDALARAHHLNIIHRDLKPANVLLDTDGSSRLTDFGVAHVESSPRLTQSGVLMGTPYYFSPEACQGKKLDARIDIWSFGIVLFEMLAGQVPFAGKAIADTIQSIIMEPLPRISHFRSDVNPQLEDLLYRMLAKDRDQRIPSARQVGAELEAIIQGRQSGNGSIPHQLTENLSLANNTLHAKPQHLDQLKAKLGVYFDEHQLKSLCYDLSIDYESLGAHGKQGKIKLLVAKLDEAGCIGNLVTHCTQRRPDIVWTMQAKLYISYKHNQQLEKELANYLEQALSDEGHQVYFDESLRTGAAWLEEIDGQIGTADFLLALVSKESIDSEMVQSEIRRAHNYHRQQGFPVILPIRVGYSGPLPYSIDSLLNPLEYLSWDSRADNRRIVQEILSAIDTGLPVRTAVPIDPNRLEVVYSEDGRLVTNEDRALPPLPEFDPRFLEELTVPGGTVRLRDRFYIERNADAEVKREIARRGSITTIRASRQTGKSSLLVRGIHHARNNGAKIINVDLQRVDRDCLVNPDAFLKYLASFIARKLRLDPAIVEQAWEGSLGPQDKLTYLMEDHVLYPAESRVILAMDEVDRLLDTDYHTDFFGLIRSWHNSAAYDELWEKLNIVMAISTEPYLLIADVNQSPFNVGLKVYLEDFTQQQVQELNRRHGSPVSRNDFPQFMSLLNGHPYLTRRALYTLVSEKLSWPEFMSVAATDKGPFSDHLRRQLWLLRERPELHIALKETVRHNRCADDAARFRLLRAGLIRASGTVCTSRCDLYRLYFQEKL